MDQLVLFGMFGAAMVGGWMGRRAVAIGLFLLTMVLMGVDYLHHATDALKLSF